MTPRSPGGGQVTAERTSKSSHCHGIKVMLSLKVIYLHTNEILSGWGRSWLTFTLSSDLQEVGNLGCNITPQTDCAASLLLEWGFDSRNDGTTETQPNTQCWSHPAATPHLSGQFWVWSSWSLYVKQGSESMGVGMILGCSSGLHREEPCEGHC